MSVAKRDREALRRGEDQSFGRERGGIAVQRIDFTKVGDALRALPFVGVNAAVDFDRDGGSRDQNAQDTENGSYVESSAV